MSRSAFNDLDMPRFLTYFAEDASIFHPPSAPPRTFPTRLQGKREIERTFQVVFDQIRTLSGRTSAPFQTIQPQDSVIQRFDGVAIVTFHLGNEKVKVLRIAISGTAPWLAFAGWLIGWTRSANLAASNKS